MGPMLKRAIVIVAVNLAVLAVAAELAGIAVFYYQTGWLFYIDPYRPVFEPIAADAGQVQGGGQALHPYFGPTHKPGIPFDLPANLAPRAGATAAAAGPRVVTNNFGFAAPFDYPYVKTDPRQFVVGIFGGSVGAWFCQVGATRLIEDLRRHAYFAAREIVPVCFSHEGYKQPQQLLVLSYFLALGQAFDLVVNIDGFNEVALGRINAERGMDASMPSAMHLAPLVDLASQNTLTPGKVAMLQAIADDRARLDRLSARLNATRLASVHVVLARYRQHVEARYLAARVAYAALPASNAEASVIRVTPPVSAHTGEALSADIAAAWSRASRLMRDSLRTHGVPYVHVLQPNQYYSRRTFTADEARVALNPSSPFRPGAEQGYPSLVREMVSGDLGKAGVNAVDATTLFDREPAAVYIDDCCHYTRRGYELLADLIAERTLAGEGSWRTSAP
jgi:hypothetical protein